MKLNMWNIYDRLPYDNMQPMINSATSTISCARWIISSTMKPDTVYIGSADGFFDHTEGDAIVVHRKDLLLIKNVDPEELFDQVCNIIEDYMDWDRKLMACLDLKDGLQKMIDVSEDFLKNPSFIYDSKGDIIAISHRYPGSTHWHWQELLQNHCVTERRIKYMKKEINLDLIFQDTQAIRRKFDDTTYIHSSLFANRFAAGHYVLFDFNTPLTPGTESLLDILINWMNIYMMRHCEEFNPMRKQTQLFLRYLKEGSLDADDEEALFESVCFRETDQFRILVVQESVDGEPVFLARTYLKITENYPDLLVAKDEKYLIILCVEKEGDPHHPVLNYMENYMREDFSIGISSEFYNFRECWLYYQQAMLELQRCIRFDSNHSAGEHHLQDYIEGILSEYQIGLAYAERLPVKLKTYDLTHDTNFYETFKVFTLCRFHKNETSAELKIHRNTLKYRLERIEEILGTTSYNDMINNFSTKKMLHMAFSFAFIDSEINHSCKNAQIDTEE